MDPVPDPQPNPQPDAAQPTPAADVEKKDKKDGFYKPWDRFTKKKRLSSVVPSLDVDSEGRPAHLNLRRNTDGIVSRLNATTSFEEAKATCIAKVDAIVRECRRLNQKYYDRLFDLPDADALISLNGSTPMSLNGLQGIGSVKRVEDIYDDPQFFVDGAAANDVRQGMNGDCWFIAAITALSGKPDLLERLCVKRDEEVGVYGFVFFRDGEWISEVVDDRLALRQSDDSTNYQTEYLLKTFGDKNPMVTSLQEMSYGIWRLPKEFRDSLRKGSNALFFASCRDSNETWLPLMEKAYAKAHGDYQAIEGGFAGEGIEDLTGGVATYIKSEDVLDKEQLWKELMQVNDKFLFGCGSRRGRDNDPADEEGFVRGHAYTVLEAREIEKPKSLIEMEEKDAGKDGPKKKKKGNNSKVRLLKLHNPWGKQEWNGAWSDGSKEWTGELMETLKHTFGDDGLFWISYEDFLRYYPEIDRIRLFGDDWTVAQQWTAVNAPWTAEYLDTSFKLTINKAGPVVLVLSQPDDRYFQGLTGRYSYDLHFRLYKEGEDIYLLRSMEDSGSNRSVKAEVDLEPGTYSVLVKVTASRNATANTPEDAIKQFRDGRREKLLAVGKSFDLTHSKGRLREREQDNEKKKKKTEQDKEHKKLVEEREQNRKERQRDRLKARRVKAEEKRKKDEKMAVKKAELKAKKEAKEAEKKRKQAEKDEEEKKAKAESKDSEKEREADATAGAEKTSSDEKSAETQDTSSNGTSTSSVGQPTPSTEKSAEDSESQPKEDEKKTKDEATSTEDNKTAKDEGTSTEDDKKTSDDSKEDKKDTKEKKGDDDKKEDDDEKKDEDEDECESSSEAEISDISSVGDDDFEWDDTMDGPLEDPDKDSDDDESKDDMYADDPWNATCVIGLRVCSMDKEASIEVVHAHLDSDEELMEKRKKRYPLYVR